MTREEWESLNLNDKVIRRDGVIGVVMGWNQHSIQGKLSIQVQWPDDPEMKQVVWGSPTSKTIQRAIDAFALYESLSGVNV